MLKVPAPCDWTLIPHVTALELYVSYLLCNRGARLASLTSEDHEGGQVAVQLAACLNGGRSFQTLCDAEKSVPMQQNQGELSDTSK